MASQADIPATIPPTYDHFLTLEEGGIAIAAQIAKPLEKKRYKLALSLELKKLLCEFIGTFILMIGCVGTSIIGNKPSSGFGIHGLAAGAGLTVMIVIFATGHISGAHVNPAVTMAFASLGRFPWLQVPLYIGAQFLGSICASFLLKGFFLHSAPGIHGGVTLPQGDDWQAFMVELTITAIMMFVVTAVATDARAAESFAAIAVSATVYLNNLLASGLTGASMNPARSLGPALAAKEFRGLWVYLLAPVFGTHLGAALYTLIR